MTGGPQGMRWPTLHTLWVRPCPLPLTRHHTQLRTVVVGTMSFPIPIQLAGRGVRGDVGGCTGARLIKALFG